MLRDAGDAQVVLASASGFADDLIAQRRATDVHLIGLDDIYRG